MEECSQLLQKRPLKGLPTVYEQQYIQHHQEAPIEYTLNSSAREVYFKYCKGKSNVQASAEHLTLSVMQKQQKRP